MLLVEALQSSAETVESLQEKYLLDVSPHKKYPNLLLFKYNQIESPMGHPLVQECRGVILDRDENWRVICRSFDKFFNNGEVHAAKIEWSTAEVQEKLDGSLMQVYWYDGKWNVATSGTPDASGQVNGFDFTFADLFWKTFEEMNLPLPPYTDVDYTYAFELMSPYNRVVVEHKEAKIALIGKRNRFSGEEIHLSKLRGNCPYPVVQAYPLGSFEEINETFHKISPMDSEGYVVCDQKMRRVKIKNPAYTRLHHLMGSASQKQILDIIRNGEMPEVVAYFKDIKDRCDEIKLKLDSLIDQSYTDYERIKHLSSQKEFAMEANKTKLPAALFKLRANKIKFISEHVKEMNIDHLMTLIGLKS